MRIGISISTRNRPDILKLNLAHMRAFRPADAKIVVVDDCSDPPVLLPEDAGDVKLVRLTKRMGSSGSKNACIRELTGCDYLFLFDDDCWPMKRGWAEQFINAGPEHLMFMTDFRGFEKLSETDKIETWDRPMGTMLFCTRHAMDVLGGYDPSLGLWGCGHTQLSLRAFRAGLCPAPYTTIRNADQWIYAADCQYYERHKQPPLGTITNFDSCIPHAEKLVEEKKGLPRIDVQTIHYDAWSKDAMPPTVKPKFSLVYTSVRPGAVMEQANKWLNSAVTGNDIELVLTTDVGQSRCIVAMMAVADVFPEKCKIVAQQDPDGTSVKGINAAVPAITGNIIVVIADDLDPAQGWDKLLLDLKCKHGSDWWDHDHAVYINDAFGGQYTHPVLSRARLARFGYLLYPGYRAVRCDREFGIVAERDGVMIDARATITFRHRHPENGLREMDDVDRKHITEEIIAHDRALFEKRKEEGFPR